MNKNKINSNMEKIDFYDDGKWNEQRRCRNFLLQREVAVINFIKSKIKEDDYFLDVGCGDGFFLTKLDSEVRKKINYFGVDYSSYQLKLAKNLSYNFIKCNVEKGLPFKNKNFNFIYAGELIEHLCNVDHFLNECNRVLRDSGYIIITTPNLNCWYNRIIFIFGGQPVFYETSVEESKIGYGILKKFKKDSRPVGHIKLFNTNSLTDILNYKGFKVLKVIGTSFPSLPKFLRYIDNFFNLIPSLASNITVIAQKYK